MSSPSSPPAPRLGLTSAVALVVANMIGAGVFTTSGFALADLGTPERVLAAWAVGGVIALCGAVSYGALLRRFPESGGEYVLRAQSLDNLFPEQSRSFFVRHYRSPRLKKELEFVRDSYAPGCQLGGDVLIDPSSVAAIPHHAPQLTLRKCG